MSTQIPKELTNVHQNVRNYFLHHVPVSEMDLDSFIIDNISGFGTTKDELVLNIRELRDLLKAQSEQDENLDSTFEHRPVHSTFSDSEHQAIIIEDLIVTVDLDDSQMVVEARVSWVYGLVNASWKLIHFHASVPSDTEGDYFHVNEWQREKEKLEQKVAEQTSDLQQKNRELEIEAATERIRSRAMAMEKPDDIWKVLGVIKKEVEAFEMGNISTWLFTFTEDGKVIHREMADYYLDGKVQDNFTVFDPNDYSASKQVVDKWGEDFFSLKFEGESLLSFLDSVSEIDPEQTQNFREAIESGHITEFWQLCSSFSKGIIGISFIETPPENAQQVLVKITEAFGLAYKRFEDLQQAEKRRHEAEMEAAVERVRAHAMGMQKPDDIMNVLNVMKEEVDKFELGNIATWIWTKDENGIITQWDISEVIEEGNLVNFNLRFDINEWPEVGRHAQEWEKGRKYYELSWQSDRLQAVVDEVRDVDPESGRLFQEAIDAGQIEEYWHATSPYSKGVVGLDFTAKPPEITEAILLKMSSAFDMAYQRFEDLQEAEQRRKEAELEAAVERVRAHAMGMQTTDDLSKVLQVLNTELGRLDLEGQNSAYLWLFNEDGTINGMNLDLRDSDKDFEIFSNTFNPQNFKNFFKPIADDWKKNPEYSVTYTGPENIRGHLEEMANSDNEVFKRYAAMAQKAVDGGLLAENWSASSGFSQGLLGCDFQKEPTDWAEKVIRKMSAAFGMAYQRFEDLQKAEAQTREAQINLAVERVRARALAMFESSEILEVVKKLRDEIMGLNIPNVTAATIHLKEPDGRYRTWDLTSVDDNGKELEISLDICYKMEDTHPDFFMREVWERTEDYFVVIQSKDRARHTVQWLQENGYPEQAKEFEEFLDSDQLERAYHPTVPLNNGRMGIDMLTPPKTEVKSILKKMAGAFDLAYKRFEDLQKAEAQTKESRIEAALERVRSRTMAMQGSDELADVGLVLFQQIEHAIGFKPESSWITFINGEENTMEIWVTADDQLVEPRIVSTLDHENFKKEIAAWKSGEEFIQITMPKEDFIQIVKKNFGMEVSDKKEHSDFHVLNVRHKYGFLGIGSWNRISDENIKIYLRFAKVFQQTYTRFLDLQKSEKQAYESKVETSLERVRGMAAAMNHSDDLMQIAEAMFKEMEILKINPLRYGIGMIDGDKKEAELWASTVNDGHYLDMLGTLSLTWHPMLNQVLDAWDAQHEELIYELKGKELADYYRKIGQVNPDIPNLKQLQDPNTDIEQFVSFFPFKTGALYAFTSGEPSEEGRSILKRFANVFEQAHIRYNDLQIAEKQARMIREERDRLEIALKELKATQDQLVQQEKLASLGQLTAGIAHEIKNPLNFVNNFSEVSVELIEEVRQEINDLRPKIKSPLEGGGSSSSDEGPGDVRKVEEALEILDDIKANLKTIHKHGSRADSIVKSMLEHSRGGAGKPEPTDLNGLVKEFVNLSFHGMRAGKNPINVDMKFELDEKIEEVPLVAEDFSRAIVNLCNNAFDAMRGKLNSESRIQFSEEYTPKLTIRTQKDNSGITLEIEDNGPGIPEDIKDKILQPFFTTKKGTEGTGLGLSITNDIIKAHGGTLEIETDPDIGSKFIITL